MASIGSYYVVFLVALFMMISITNSSNLQCWQFSVNPDLQAFGSIADNVGDVASSLVR